MDNPSKESESFYHIFFPLTTKKAILFLILGGVIVFFNMLFNGFSWDDYTYVVNNSDIHTLNVFHLFGMSIFNSSGYYRPLTAVYFAILYHFFTLQPFYYHFIQLILHILDTCLLFYFLKRFFLNTQAFLLALLFLIHPIQVESVAFISACLSELFFLFGISALLVGQSKPLRMSHPFLVGVLLLFSILAKETGFLFYILFGLYLLFFNPRKIPAGLFVLTISAGLYLYLRFVFANVVLSNDMYLPLTHLSMLQRFINIPEIIFYYIKTLIYPAQLAIDQLWYISSIDVSHFYLPLGIDILFFAILGWIGFYCYQKNKDSLKIFLFFLIWFVSGLLILLQIYPIDLTVSDRWMYFPLAGLLGMLGVGLKYRPKLSKRIHMVEIYFLVALFIILGTRTIIRNSNWYNDFTINSHDESVLTNFDLENNLGVDYLASGQCGSARIHFTKSVVLSPNDVNLDNLGLADACVKRFKEAKIAYMHAMTAPGYLVGKQHKHFLALYINVINFFVLNGNPHQALTYIDQALQDYPNNSVLYHYLAAAEYKLGNKIIAAQDEKKANALTPTPGYVDVYLLIKRGTKITVQ